MLFDKTRFQTGVNERVLLKSHFDARWYMKRMRLSYISQPLFDVFWYFSTTISDDATLTIHLLCRYTYAECYYVVKRLKNSTKKNKKIKIFQNHKAKTWTVDMPQASPPSFPLGLYEVTVRGGSGFHRPSQFSCPCLKLGRDRPGRIGTGAGWAEKNDGSP